MKQILPLLLLIMLMISACGKKETKAQTKAKAPANLPPTELNIWGLQRLRTGGFEHTVIKDYSIRYNCKINLRLFGNIQTLIDTLIAEKDKQPADIILNLDNSFLANEELRSMFTTIPDFSSFQLNRDLMPDVYKRLLPYAYANLGVVYNTHIFNKGPQSFGELQDARYFRQLGICDPKTTGEGRGTLYWTLALFGSGGYEHLWKSIRKNIRQVYPDYESGIQALKEGKIGMLIGYNLTPVWLAETQQTDKSFQFSAFKEGAWQYSESAGILSNAKNYSAASGFMKYLHSPEAQLMVIYKLGLFPAASKTTLPVNFARIPISSFVVNRRLTEASIAEELPLWLQFWEQLFDPGISFL